MDRRQMFAAAFGGAAALLLPGPGVAAARRNWVPVLKADVPSVNGNVYPAAVVAASLGRLGWCPVLVAGPPVRQYHPDNPPGWREFDARRMDEVGRVRGWRFDGAWLWADVTEHTPPPGQLLVTSLMTENVRAGKGLRMTVLKEAVNLYYCPRDEASWPDRPAAEGA